MISLYRAASNVLKKRVLVCGSGTLVDKQRVRCLVRTKRSSWLRPWRVRKGLALQGKMMQRLMVKARLIPRLLACRRCIFVTRTTYAVILLQVNSNNYLDLAKSGVEAGEADGADAGSGHGRRQEVQPADEPGGYNCSLVSASLSPLTACSHGARISGARCSERVN